MAHLTLIKMDTGTSEVDEEDQKRVSDAKKEASMSEVDCDVKPSLIKNYYLKLTYLISFSKIFIHIFYELLI